MTQCVERNQDLVRAAIKNNTEKLSVIEKQMKDPDVKTNNLCCMVYVIENSIRDIFNQKCPGETDTVVNIYRAVLQDVMDLICRQPKCVDIFKGYKIVKQTKRDGIISILLRIVFTLG